MLCGTMRHEQLGEPMNNELKVIALAMTLNCVRNTVIENYHCQGKLTDADMKAFNKEVANRIYTFLDCWLNRAGQERDLFLGKMAAASESFTAKWDEPEIDKTLWSGEKSLEDRIRKIQGMAKGGQSSSNRSLALP